MRLLLITVLFLCVMTSHGLATTTDVPLKNSTQEKHAQQLFKAIRCLVCQGESIADSKAELAQDLRNTIRRQIKNQKTHQDILDFLTSRYGSAILMKPPVEPATYLLWFLPIVLLSLGMVVIIRYVIPKSEDPKPLPTFDPDHSDSDNNDSE